MIGIVVATHGALACELLKTASLFCSNQTATDYVNFYFEDSTEDLYLRLQNAVNKVDQGDGIFILTDLEGGSPSNQSTRFIFDRDDIEVIAGVNLPMLLTILMGRENETMDTLKETVLCSARAGIASINEKTKKRLEKLKKESDMDDIL